LFIPTLDESVIDMIVSGVSERPSEMTYSSLWYLGEAVRSVSADATGFGDRSQPWLFSIDGIWSKPEHDELNIGWVRQLWSAMRPHSNGRVYLNFFAGADGEPATIRDSIGAETYERLVTIKRKYDPTNFFRLNQNIAPD
jgi:Berberine and berberine like